MVSHNVFEHRGAAGDHVANRWLALRQAQVAGVEAIWTDGDIGLRGNAAGFGERPERRLLASRVRVEGEHHFTEPGIGWQDALE